MRFRSDVRTRRFNSSYRRPPVCNGQVVEHVEGTGVGVPGRASKRSDGVGIDDDGQLPGFRVGHAGDTKSGIEISQRCGESFGVVCGGGGHDIEIVGLMSCAADLRAEPSDDDIFDTMSVEHLENLLRVDLD